MSLVAVNGFLAIAPAALLLYYFLRDRAKSPERLKLVTSSTALGIVSILPIAFLGGLSVSVFAGMSQPQRLFADAFVVAGLCEEGIKLILAWFFYCRAKGFGGEGDGIRFAVCASMGFALFENLLYVSGDTLTLAIRGISAIPLHAATGGIIGYFATKARKSKRPLGPLACGLFLAILCHGSYDFSLSIGLPWAIAAPIIAIATMSWALKKYRRQDALDRRR